MSLKIIVIANGPNALKYDAGDVIDSFDIVIRMNCYQIEGYEKQLGTKTDIWVTTNDFDRFIADYEGLLEKRKKESFKENWTTDPQDYEFFVDKHQIDVDEIHLINLWMKNTFGNFVKDGEIHEKFINLKTFDDGIISSMHKSCRVTVLDEKQTIKVKSNRNLSTGLHTLCYAIARYKGEDIYILGFDFFKSGKEYFATPKSTWEMAHDGTAEAAIVKRWKEAGILKEFAGVIDDVGS